MKEHEIKYWNRKQQRLNTEKILDQAIMVFFYDTSIGRFLTRIFFSKTIFSFVYALFYDGKRSRKKIEPFIEKFNVMMADFEPKAYESFNDFFIRRFKAGLRSYAQEPSTMPAFAEARYLGWAAMPPDETFPVKGIYLTPQVLLDSHEKARAFINGPIVIGRLAPQDYHRFHFIDRGKIVEYYRVMGNLNSVNPIALLSKADILCTNTRDVTIQETENFGLVAYIEIGAMTVGKIVQYNKPGDTVNRGDEKGYFKYGSSTVVLLGERERWIPDREILKYTEKGIESFVELGTQIAAGLDI